MKQILLTVLISFSATSFAKGGMVGGGELAYKPHLVCDGAALGDDQSGGDGQYRVLVAQEVDYEGIFIPNATLRIIVEDSSGEISAIYVTRSTQVYSDEAFNVNLALWRHDEGSDINVQIGTFDWNEGIKAGSITATDADVLNMNLANCFPVPVAN